MKILSICKQRYAYNFDTGETSLLSSGLWNSALMVAKMLDRVKGIDTKIVDVVDNNSIDREMSIYQPDVVVIEAYWVVPEKFEVLNKLHPGVKWIVRCHSNIPFFANEGITVEWTVDYLSKYKNVWVATNNKEALRAVRLLAKSNVGSPERTIYFPNFYDFPVNPSFPPKDPRVLNIGCFGAIRPLKNHLNQAVAALEYADGKEFNFHINTGRIEGKGEPILKNLRALFEGSANGRLVEHEWLTHEEFLPLMGSMDVHMQVSYSETFNLVTADAIAMGVPVVVSDQIGWVPSLFHADPNSTRSISCALRRAEFLDEVGIAARWNKRRLHKYNVQAKKDIVRAIGSVVLAQV